MSLTRSRAVTKLKSINRWKKVAVAWKEEPSTAAAPNAIADSMFTNGPTSRSSITMMEHTKTKTKKAKTKAKAKAKNKRSGKVAPAPDIEIKDYE